MPADFLEQVYKFTYPWELLVVHIMTQAVIIISFILNNQLYNSGILFWF